MFDWEGTTTFTYNADGIRTKQYWENDGYLTETREYILDENNRLLGEIFVSTNSEGIDQEYSILYFYDESGSPIYCECEGYTYYYVKNQQGDITGLMLSDGTIVVTYEYDAWGNILNITGGRPHTAVRKMNSYTYRGYQYDQTTGFYYLQSRYYDPEVGRFLNADDTNYLGATGTTLGYNLYAYCENNGVNRIDPSGYLSIDRTWFAISADVIIGLVSSYAKFSYDLIGSGLRALSKKFGQKYLLDVLAGTVPKIVHWASKFLTALKTVLWRLGFASLTALLTDIGNGIASLSVFICNKLFKTKLTQNDASTLSCFFTTGGIIALFFDWVSDKKIDRQD